MSLSQNINCPHCRKGFELSDALSHDLEQRLQNQVDQEIKKQQELFAKRLKSIEAERADVDQELKKQQELFEKRLKSIQAEKQEADQKAEEEKRQLKMKLEKELSSKMQEKYELECKDLANQLQEQKQKAQLAQQKELDLLKKQRDLENQKQDFELLMKRKMEEERHTIATELKMRLEQESSLKLGEKEKELNDLKAQIDELKRKTQVTSQQLQGEILEIQIESLLRELCPDDNIEEVKKGVRGADVYQEILLQSGRKAGSVLYECKQTMEWGNQWVVKLKDNMRSRNADVGVIVSTILPKNVKFMDFYDGVWVCSPTMLKPLAMLLREGLIKAARAELVAATPQDQRDYLFKYMTSPKFIQKIQAVCEVSHQMKETLESEKRSLQKNWKKREQEIEVLEEQMINLYGELQGVVGKALPRVDVLELGSGDEE